MKKLFFASLTAITLVLVLNGHAAYAAPTPEGCFEFDSATKTITGYYNNEANNPANPVCSRDVAIPSTIGGVTVISIGYHAFSNKQLTSVIIPNSVTFIEGNAFYVNQLTTLNIPGSVTSIGPSAFYDNQLTTLTIPNSVTSIDDFAFSNNHLTTLELGNSVASIGEHAFSNNHLTSVTIPNSVTSIRNKVFAYQSTSPTFEDDFYSDDPVKVQSALDSIILVKLYIADPSNPAGLKDSILVVDESIHQEWDCIPTDSCPRDINGDGDTDDTFVFGGYIVNPASVTTTYKNQSGAELAPSTTAISSNPAVKAYLAKDVPLNIDPTNGSTADTSSYYHINQQATFTAPTIAGYSTISPSSPHTTRLAAADNTVDFVYGNLRQPIADVVAPTTGALASTGMGLWRIASIAGVAILGSFAVLLRRR